VCTIGGSPSLRRSFMMVIRTMLVNGSMVASQTRSSSSSLLTAAPSGDQERAQHAELLRRQRELAP
jgi:hypothetical protein